MRLALALMIATACASPHRDTKYPKAPWVRIDIRNGSDHYIKNGIARPHGRWGDGLLDTVRGSSAATSLAKRYQTQTFWGAVLAGLGIGCAVTAETVGLISAVAEENQDHLQKAHYIALGCAIVGVAGAVIAIGADSYRHEAIAVYNDEVFEKIGLFSKVRKRALEVGTVGEDDGGALPRPRLLRKPETPPKPKPLTPTSDNESRAEDTP